MLGGLSETPYSAGSLTAAANATMWNTWSAAFGGASMLDILVPVVVAAVVVLLALFWFLRLAGREAGL